MSDDDLALAALTSVRDLLATTHVALNAQGMRAQKLEGIPEPTRGVVIVAQANEQKANQATVSQAVAGLANRLTNVRFDPTLQIELHQDPLGAATRTARRNVDGTAATIILGATLASGSVSILGLTASLGLELGSLAASVLAYHTITFALYQRADRQALKYRRENADLYVARARAMISEIDVILQQGGPSLREATGADLRAKITMWRDSQDAALKSYSADLDQVRVRGAWEFNVPFILAAIALLSLLLRVVGIAPLGH